MEKRRWRSIIVNILEMACSILPSVFWGLILFGFEEASMAVTTLLCALIHELGHIVCILALSKKSFGFRSVISGFRISTPGIRSYNEEILTYLSGPLANIFAFVISVILSFLGESFFLTIAIINLATALSNLLPIKGYDGYGAIIAFMKMMEMRESVFKGLSYLSASLIFGLCIFSIYLIDRYGGGYWIFAVFFISMLKEIRERLDE